MLEIPEVVTIAKQLNEAVRGKTINKVIAGYTEHKLAWYNGKPEQCSDWLNNKVIGETRAVGGIIEIAIDNCLLLLSDGVNLRYLEKTESCPGKHQLYLQFSDDSCLVAVVQMYGGICCYDGKPDNKYYLLALSKPSPLSDNFSEDYFHSLTVSPEYLKLSAKAFLATEQRIPGLGNGVLQDILFKASIHPKRKMSSLTIKEIDKLFYSLKSTLQEMTKEGGRNNEKDLFGKVGNYKVIMSKKTVNNPCPVCSTLIKKDNYLGGAVYFCPKCQKLEK
ncbi:MAG: endonuclease VIII [Candidatus Cloacimonetes bacterium]|nr:endonuclease VIII [Candidatus Cloacimonadota bacterium]